jgi:Family of unknown function (DUF5670)
VSGIPPGRAAQRSASTGIEKLDNWNLRRLPGINKTSAVAVPKAKQEKTTKGNSMLWTIFFILLILWLLGWLTSYTLGGFIHILLVIALVVLIIRLIQGRRVL